MDSLIFYTIKGGSMDRDSKYSLDLLKEYNKERCFCQ